MSTQEIDRQAIMSRALRHGFTLRQQPGGEMDLNEYVYAFAREVFEAGLRAGAAESPCQGHAKQQEADHSENGLELVGRLGCNSQHGGYRPDSPCRYRMRITDPGCTGCADRDEGGTDHANELRRMARKVGHPAGDVPAVMRAAADRIDELERLVAAFQRAEDPAPPFQGNARQQEAEQNAARYRWLRQSKSNPAYAARSTAYGVSMLRLELLDEAIDAAMQSTEGRVEDG